MIPVIGCDPRINVVRIGAYILYKLKTGPIDLRQLIENCSSYYNISIDHVILTLDWLYTISAIDINTNEIKINETK